MAGHPKSAAKIEGYQGATALARIRIHFYNPIMNQSSQLYQLQKIDSELDKTNARLAEIARLLESDESVLTAQQQLESARRNEYKKRSELQNKEALAREINIKIDTSNSSLYGGKIRNPKELQDLQEEISSLKRRLGSLEDEQLEAMLALDQAEATHKSASESLDQANANFAMQQSGLIGEQSKLQKNVDRLMVEREYTAGSILPDNISVYERLRKQKRGLAVAAVEDNACTACGSTIRPAEQQAARAPQAMAFCSSCGRILYAG
jgi:predicted  nucleic acid-binding Zn-ribbon protein